MGFKDVNEVRQGKYCEIDTKETDNDKAKANDSFQKAQKIIDTAAAKKVIHKNAAARTKSRLSKAIKNLG